MDKKAFIFDFDGVILNTEPLWEKAKQEIFLNLFGEDIYHKLGNTVGVSMEGIHAKAKDLGSNKSLEEVVAIFNSYASEIYKNSPITPATDFLKNRLIELGFIVGIVSASPKEWLDIAIQRLKWGTEITLILSLADRQDIKHKPSPQGYLEIMRLLDVQNSRTIALEDSNSGIASAKAAGIYTIGLKENLVPGQPQTGADVYANTMREVLEIVEKLQI